MANKIEFSILLPDATGWKLRRYIPIPPDLAHYFPPVDKQFVLHTRAGDITTKLSGQAPHFSLLVGLGILFDKCPFLQPKEKIHFEKMSSEEFILEIPKWNQTLDASPTEKEESSIDSEIRAYHIQQLPSPLIEDSSRPLQGKSSGAPKTPLHEKQQTKNLDKIKPTRAVEQARFSVSLPRKIIEWKEGRYIELPKNHSKSISSLAVQGFPLILHTPWGKIQQEGGPESNKLSKNYRIMGMDRLFKHNPDLQTGDALIFTHTGEGNFNLEVKKIGPRKTSSRHKQVPEESRKKTRQRKSEEISDNSSENLLDVTAGAIAKQNPIVPESRRSWLEHIRFMVSNILVIPDMKDYFSLPFPSDSFVAHIFSQLRRIQQELLIEINSRMEQTQVSDLVTGKINEPNSRENVANEIKDQGMITSSTPLVVSSSIEHQKDVDSVKNVESYVNSGSAPKSTQQPSLSIKNQIVMQSEKEGEIKDIKKGFEQRYREFWSQLKDYHISLIKDILEEKKGFDRIIRKLAQEHKCMPEEIIDHINNLAYNCFGDTLIDTTNESKKIIPEYLPRVTEAISKCEINEAEIGKQKDN